MKFRLSSISRGKTLPSLGRRVQSDDSAATQADRGNGAKRLNRGRFTSRSAQRVDDPGTNLLAQRTSRKLVGSDASHHDWFAIHSSTSLHRPREDASPLSLSRQNVWI